MEKPGLYCKDCKYCVKNDASDGITICTYESRWEITDPDGNCRYIPETKEPVCGDCRWITEDTACWGCLPEESALHQGELCKHFCYKNENAFYEVLSYWKSHGIFNKIEIFKKIEDFEKSYDELVVDMKKGS